MSFPMFLGRYLTWITIFLLQLSIDFSFSNELTKIYDKECNGTEIGLNHSGSSNDRYEEYHEMYTNCTFVNSNLEIVFLEETEDQYDLSFLNDIREVRGYVLIYGNHVGKIPLTGLRVIRGVQLFQLQKNAREPRFGLYVAQNYLPGNNSVGLKKLELTSLAEILSGDVFLEGNMHMCFDEYTINWNYTLNGRIANVSRFGLTGYSNIELCSESCHRNCMAYDGNRYCWGTGPDMCQKVVQCERCGSRRCWAPNQCCDAQCSAGCTGPNRTECLACRSFTDNDRCVGQCKGTDDGIVKYAYQERCVTQCPENTVKAEGKCLPECPFGFVEGENRECVECVGNCPQICLGTSTLLDGRNIENVRRCRTLNGSLRITNGTFYGEADVKPMSVSELSKLRNLEEITGSFTIEAWHQDLTNLSFCFNLRTIGGQITGTDEFALKITRTSLEYIGLPSLTEVKQGDIIVSGNSDLCYLNTMNWKLLFRDKNKRQKAIVMDNKNATICVKDGFNCSSFCDGSGCWGPSTTDCIYCPVKLPNGSCVVECPFDEGFYEHRGIDWGLWQWSSETMWDIRVGLYRYWDGIHRWHFPIHHIRIRESCERCHDECLGTCSYEGSAGCNKCKNVRHQHKCEPKCPSGYYPDEMKVCQTCHNACQECTGNSSRLGVNGCMKCRNPILRIEDENVNYCILNVSDCGEDYYTAEKDSYIDTNKSGCYALMKTCHKCHQECNGCKAEGPKGCKKCRNFQQTISGSPDECVSNCSVDKGYYLSGESLCLPCHSECGVCHGPGEKNCTLCRNARINLPITGSDLYSDGVDNSKSNQVLCAKECPSDQPNGRKDNDTEEWVCSPPTEHKINSSTIVVLLLVALMFFIVVTIIVFVIWRKQKSRRLQEKMLANEEIPMTSTSKVKPDMSLLRLIKESELRRNNMIGSGAFGTVYKGVWIPEKEKVRIPVAIKVLKHTDTKLEVGLLEEARIMASVCHPNCVRILAVCMTEHMMLITQLMPFGCLLDYVRKEKFNIGSRSLLLWSVQIAKGMKYLEDVGIVHRDLAARNVLVHNQNQVRITDFGLARLLDDDQKEVHSEEGKMPIKWLALECIKGGVYTHKSDVWSYGVTLWEMYSFGDKPYEDIRVHQIYSSLERGERLPQPAICTIDIYMLMIKCWFLDSDARPTFTDLIKEFTRMAQDPGRFLVIPGDKLLRPSVIIPDTEELLQGMNLPLDESGLEAVTGDDYYLRPKDSEEYAKYTYISEKQGHQNYDYARSTSKEDELKCGKVHLNSANYQNVYEEERSLNQLEKNQQLDVDDDRYQPLQATCISYNYLKLDHQSSGIPTYSPVECRTADINKPASDETTYDNGDHSRSEDLISPTNCNTHADEIQATIENGKQNP